MIAKNSELVYGHSIKSVFVLFLVSFTVLTSTLYDRLFAHSSGDHAKLGDIHRKASIHIDIPDTELVSAKGEPKRILELLAGDAPVYINFIYTSCPSVCPVMAETFSQLQDLTSSLKNGVRLISISVDPEFDTPSKLLEYSRSFNAGANWTFLTGTSANSIAIQKAFSVYRPDKMNHPLATFMRAAGNREWIRIDGFPTAIQLYSELDIPKP